MDGLLIKLVLGSLQGTPGLGEVGHCDGGSGACSLNKRVVGQCSGCRVVSLVPIETGGDFAAISARLSLKALPQARLVETAPPEA